MECYRILPSSCCAHTHIHRVFGKFYVIIYLKRRWCRWRQQLPISPPAAPSNANHLFWHSISFSLSKAKERKTSWLFNKVCADSLIWCCIHIQIHTRTYTTFRPLSSSSSPTPSQTISPPPPPLNHRPFKWTLFKNHQAAINKYFSNDWFYPTPALSFPWSLLTEIQRLK